jgi:hypothetical protein
MSAEHAAEFADRLSGFKRLAVGVPSAAFPATAISLPGARFQDAAIAIGDWYLTQLRGDVDVIRSHADARERSLLGRFYRLLKDQRDYIAHPADYDRKAEAEAWREDVRQRSNPSEGDALVNELVTELCAVLECLCAVAARIVNNPKQSEAWRQMAAASPEEEVRAVYENLGRHLPQNRLKYVVLQFTKHPELARARSPRQRANIGELVALGVLAAPLRVPYDEILDEFGLVGDARASALLLLAHGAQAAGVPDSRFMDVLMDIWEVLQRPGVSPA